MKNILIIGGSYFTGRIFVEELLKDREECSIYTLNRGTKPLNLSEIIELKCDRHNKIELLECLPKMHWDVVVDFCAYTPDDIKTIFRPAIIYGKYNYVNREKYFFDLIADNKEVIIPSDSLALFSMIYVQDIAKILFLAVKKKLLNKTLNLSGTELISYTGIIRTLRQIAGKIITVRKLSSREIIRQKIPLPFPIDQHLIYSGNAILKEINFQYTSIFDGMEDTYKFYGKSGER